MNNGTPNIPTKEIGELLEVVSAKVPGFLNDLLGILYSAEAGARVGKAVGAFYSELTRSGIPANEALQMSKDYMNYVKSVASELVPKSITQDNSVRGLPRH
ncbi:hypothetical protein [Gordoniibacillus kamchatkensis]|uniref:hypothetical protein n=1 Tax=Gordoniibacillus kamchatkensis TaxID=1590651 RepID=UPI000695B82C|nr:hypothetical protein [Paenibacillus sp. VKM B-2647]